MTSLVLRLEGPLQSWGLDNFLIRGTHSHPTKTGVLGLLAACLGRDRTDTLADLAALTMRIRVDRAGRPLDDYTTVGVKGSDDPRRTYDEPPILITKGYLADASFLVVLTGDEGLIAQCAAALQRPYWAPYLGRRCCPPSTPILVGVDPRDPDAILTDHTNRPQTVDGPQARIVTETGDPQRAQSINDQPGAERGEYRIGHYRHRLHTFPRDADQTSHDPFDLLDLVTDDEPADPFDLLDDPDTNQEEDPTTTADLEEDLA